MPIPIESIDILLIEDNMNDVQLVTAALEENHVVNKIIHLKDGADASDYLFHEGSYASSPPNNNPKIIMLDINMPKVTGIELLKKLKADERTKDIPIVIFTSSHQDPHLKEAYRLGVNNYVLKPIDFEQFKQSINKSISGLLAYSARFR